MPKERTKRREARATFEYLRPLVQFEDRGIYRYARVVGNETISLTREEHDQLSRPVPWDSHLRNAVSWAKDAAVDIVRPHATPIERPEKSLDEVAYDQAPYAILWQTVYKSGLFTTTLALRRDDQYETILDLGSGRRWYAFPLEISERVKTAIDTLHCVAGLDAGGAASLCHAIQLGRLAERLYVMPFEHEALKGKRQTERARAAGKTRELLTPEQQRLAGDEIAHLVADGMDVEPACKSLVAKYGVSLSTLKRCYRRRGQPSD